MGRIIDVVNLRMFDNIIFEYETNSTNKYIINEIKSRMNNKK